MNRLPSFKQNTIVTLLAVFAFALGAGAPLSAEAYDDGIVKKVKVKDHKVKVRTVNGKAKIKHKAGEKEKVKVKGPTGQIAAAIAADAAGHPPRGHGRSGGYGYQK